MNSPKQENISNDSGIINISQLDTTYRYPVARRITKEGNIELTFGGIIQMPSGKLSKAAKNAIITKMLSRFFPESVISLKSNGKTVKVELSEFLNYGTLQITTENYKYYPQKINCCTVFWNPPIYFKGRIAYVIGCFILIPLISPIIVVLIVFIPNFIKFRYVYNLYMKMVDDAAKNIRKNKGTYVPRHYEELQMIQKLQMIQSNTYNQNIPIMTNFPDPNNINNQKIYQNDIQYSAPMYISSSPYEENKINAKDELI